MKLKSFGCSFVYGNELNDCNGQASNLTWPALIAKRLGLDYECYAQAGCGNLHIANNILNQVSVEPAVYVINWTWIDRFDYVNSANDSWISLLPNDTSENSNYYFKHIHSQFRDKLTTLMHMKMTLDTLQQCQQKFIMTLMDETVFETQWHTSGSVAFLQQKIEPYIKRFDGLSFLDWSRRNGYPESNLWHPLETAHQAAADYAWQHFIPALSK